MGAYNKYEGDHCCESHFLLEEVLREDWSFRGFTISDFIYGIRDTAKAIEAGMDVEMPMPVKYQKNLLKAVRSGKVSEKFIDRSVKRILETQLNFEHARDPNIYNEKMVASEEHTALAEEVALKSMVLIKNQDNLLPLESDTIEKVLLVGRLAGEKNTGDHGSSQVFPPYVVTPLEGFRNYFGEDAEVLHCREDEIEKAKELAAQADLVVIFAGYDYRDEGEFVVPQETEGEHPLVTGTKNQGMFLKSLLIKLMLRNLADSYTSDDGEPVGGDRQDLGLNQEQVKMIQEVGGINSNTVVSLISGSMIMTSEWEGQVPAVFYSWYSGMEGGNALPKLIFGDETPGGKLPFTVPEDESHLPYFSSTDDEITYDLYHGYTLLDKSGHKSAYPFGFGLSYTTFAISDIQVRQQNQIHVIFTIENTGSRDGSEVVQVYAGMADSEVERPVKLLKGFQKVSLTAGASDQVELRIDLKDLRYFSNEERQWIFESGKYQFYIGTSAADSDLEKFEIHLKM
jgi:beta-glucosidase